ncbi:MAG: nucleotidyltransferase domain-containing protein [Candidatus Omnitrophica bacterium]|nr:nucleotidyltransferase domain-containing protein [Candidatus Omnitrophota bacterium]
MLTKNKVIEILRKEQPYLRENFGVKKIAIFGSFAKGHPHQKSDVDILVEFHKSLGMRFLDLMDYLENKLSRKTEVLTQEGLSTIRVKRVAQEIKKTLIYV